MKARRIGIVGGTFNPIHNGHLLLGECAREEYLLDRVIFIPSGISYLKSGQTDIPAGEIRYQMVKQAIAGNPYFTCSRVEIDRGGNTYTADTLEELGRMYPGDELYFIIGGDSLLSMDTWVRPQDVFDRAVILAAVRDGFDIEEMERKRKELTERFSARIELLKYARMDISSSDIRERFRSGRSVRYLLPDSCIEFARLKNLYTVVSPREAGAIRDEDYDMKIV